MVNYLQQYAPFQAQDFATPLLEAPQKNGLLGISERLSGLATNPLFNFGMGMLGSQSPHLSNALAAGGQQMQQGVMLGEKMKDNSANREYRDKMLELAKQRQNPENTMTQAMKNASFMFPNDPVKQRQAVQDILFKQGQNPAVIQEMDWLMNPDRTQAEIDNYWNAKRATRNVTIGGVPTDIPNNPSAAAKPLSSLDKEANAKEVLAASARTGQITAENKATAQADLPQAEIKAEQAIKLIDDTLSHPGLTAVIGIPNVFEGGFGPLGNVPGSPAADFQTYLDQIGGQVFLEAYQGLKGGGQITEVEGEQAKKALARMGSAQSEGSFKSALNDYKSVIMKGLERARKKAGVAQPSGPVSINSDQEYNALPSGTEFIAPDGTRRIKP